VYQGTVPVSGVWAPLIVRSWPRARDVQTVLSRPATMGG